MSARPKVGFLGLGWIGRARLRSLADSGLVEIVALADPSPGALKEAAVWAPSARCLTSLDELLACDLDAVVIATPSGLHAGACVRAFESGRAVFCQKPLAADARQTRRVLEEAARADRLLRVDLCYRQTSGLRALRELVLAGGIGRVYAGELTFHNAYGPDKAWARDPELSGGGCLIDLGVHLLDAALWALDARVVKSASSRRFSGGRAVSNIDPAPVEDFALGEVVLGDDTALSLACSWQSSFGDHARIRVALFGERGGACFENVGGSFYDFACERFEGAQRVSLAQGAEDWAGRAIISWAQELTESARHRPDPQLMVLANALDALYGRETLGSLDLRAAS